jgi:hypothetical protein
MIDKIIKKKKNIFSKHAMAYIDNKNEYISATAFQRIKKIPLFLSFLDL